MRQSHLRFACRELKFQLFSSNPILFSKPIASSTCVHRACQRHIHPILFQLLVSLLNSSLPGAFSIKSTTSLYIKWVSRPFILTDAIVFVFQSISFNPSMPYVFFSCALFRLGQLHLLRSKNITSTLLFSCFLKKRRVASRIRLSSLLFNLGGGLFYNFKTHISSCFFNLAMCLI